MLYTLAISVLLSAVSFFSAESINVTSITKDDYVAYKKNPFEDTGGITQGLFPERFGSLRGFICCTASLHGMPFNFATVAPI